MHRDEAALFSHSSCSSASPLKRSGKGDDWRQFCPAQWLAVFVGKMPLAPPVTPDLDIDASGSSIARRGPSFTCHSPTRCGTDINGPCKCVEPDAKTATKYGLDPISPFA